MICSILIALPFTVLHIIGVSKYTLREKAYRDKYGEMYIESRREENYSRGLYYPLFLMHRYFFVFIVFTLDYGLPQALVMLLATVLFLFYLFRWLPFRSTFDQFLNIFSTIILAVLYAFCVLFSFTLPLEIRESLGLAFLFSVLLLFLINLTLILVNKIITFRDACRARKFRKEAAKRLERFKSNAPPPPSSPPLARQNTWVKPLTTANWGTAQDDTFGNMPVISAIRR